MDWKEISRLFAQEQFDEQIGYSTLMRFLHERDYRLKVPQPWSDRQDEQKRRAFCVQLETLWSDPTVEIWFADETGVEGDPRPRRRWIKKGQKGRITKNGDHLRMNVTGAICPRTGQAYLLEFSHSDTQTFQAFLNEANKEISLKRPRQILILDNASWHKSKSLDWGRFEPLYLPPYSPDLNPIERLWLLMKVHGFSDFVAKNVDHLIQRLHLALCWLIDRGPKNKKTCSIKTKL